MKTIFSLLLLLPLMAWGSDKRIIGTDDRYQIFDLSEDIHKTVGIVEYADLEKAYCTGTLIGPKHVITNGHCVVKKIDGITTLYDPKLITFTPGRLVEGGVPFGSFRGAKIHTFDVWLESRKPEFDLAVIELEDEVMRPVAQIEKFKNSDELKRTPIFISGYSGWKPAGTMWEGHGSFVGVLDNGQQFHHTIDTMTGTSGSLIRRKVGNEWVGIGIHRGSGYPVPNVNTGVLFNDKIYRAINYWLKK